MLYYFWDPLRLWFPGATVVPSKCRYFACLVATYDSNVFHIVLAFATSDPNVMFWHVCSMTASLCSSGPCGSMVVVVHMILVVLVGPAVPAVPVSELYRGLGGPHGPFWSM